MKISEITPNKTYFYSEQLTSDIIKWPLLNKLTNLHMHQNSPNMCPPWTSKDTLYFKFKNGGIPLDLHFVITYEQTTSGQHRNHSRRQTKIYHNFFSHCIIIQTQTQKQKTIRHYQEPFGFTLSKIQWFIIQHHQH